jgi:MbtH protein
MSEVRAGGAGGSFIGAAAGTWVPAVPSVSLAGMRFTMANPFEDPDASYRVLVNHEGQHSLWPANQPTPDGWTVAHDTDSRANCLEYIEKNWTDMRPLSLIQAQGG